MANSANKMPGKLPAWALLILATLFLVSCGQVVSPTLPEVSVVSKVATSPSVLPATPNTTPLPLTNTPVPQQAFPIGVHTSREVTTSFRSADWEYQWLTGIPCSPPCWQGITPGVTDFGQAVKIVEQLPSVMYIHERDLGNRYGISWGWSKAASGEAYYSKQDGKKIITYINLRFDKTFRLGDIVVCQVSLVIYSLRF